VQCRQTLCGADYGLIDDATLEPTPDFWASLLWTRLMGRAVLRVVPLGAPPTVRAYAHADLYVHDGVRTRGRATYLVLNFGDAAVDVTLPAADGAAAAEVWLLQGATLDARTCTINGVQAAAAPDGTVPDFPPKREAQPCVPAGAALFFRV